MKALLLFIVLLVCFSVPVKAQPSSAIIPVVVDPSGTCYAPIPMQFNSANGKYWGCVAGTWTQVTGGTGGTGGVQCAATGSATNTLVCAGSPAPSAYAAGMNASLSLDGNTSGAVTLNIATLGAKNVFLNGAALSSTSILSNGSGTGNIYSLDYDGTRFNVTGMINQTGKSSGINTPGPLSSGSSPPAVTGTGIQALAESTGQVCVSGADCFIADSATKATKLSMNNDTALPITRTVAYGITALGTGAVSANDCRTVSASAPGANLSLLNDVIAANPTTTIKGLTGYGGGGLQTPQPWLSANTANFDICNPTALPITPSALTMNWSVLRPGAGTIVPGSLAFGTIGITSAGSSPNVNYTTLTSTGVGADWIDYSYAPGTPNRKATGGSQISNVALIGSGTPSRQNYGPPPNMVWTDGTPNASVTSGTTYLEDPVTSGGFSFTVPASTTPRTIHVYVTMLSFNGGAAGTVSASLSDGSAASINTVLNPTNQPVNQNYDVPITYNSSSPTILTVSWLANSGCCGDQIGISGVVLIGQ